MYGIDSNSFQRFYSFFRQSCVKSFYLCYCGDSVRNVETDFNTKRTTYLKKRKYVYLIKAFKFIKILKFVHEV